MTKRKKNAINTVSEELITELKEKGAADIVEKYQVGDEIDVPKFGSENSRTALMMAARGGHFEAVSLLLEQGANIEAVDEVGYTAFMIAAVTGQVESMRLLLEHGANIEAVAKDGSTALMLAALNGHVEPMRLLLEHGANIEAVDEDGKTALMIAAEEGHVESMSFLLEHGANIEAVDEDGETALMLAARYGQVESMSFLLEQGANIEVVNKYEWTPLIIAAGKGHLESVSLLLEEGANIEAVDCCESTGLMMAAEYGRVEVIKLLLEHGANIEAVDEGGSTALTKAVHGGHFEAVSLLFEQGPNIDDRNHSAKTLLQFATEIGYFQVVKILILAAADIDVMKGFSWGSGDDEISNNQSKIREYIEKTKEIYKLANKGNSPIAYEEVSKVINAEEFVAILEAYLVRQGCGNFKKYKEMVQKNDTLPEEIKEKIVRIIENNEEKYAVKIGELLHIISGGEVSPAPLKQIVMQKLEGKYGFDEQAKEAAIAVVKYYQELGVDFTDELEAIFKVEGNVQIEKAVKARIEKEIEAGNVKILTEHIATMMVQNSEACKVIKTIGREVILPMGLKKKVQEADNKYQEMQNNPIAKAILDLNITKNEEIEMLQKELKGQKAKIGFLENTLMKLVVHTGLSIDTEETVDALEIVGEEAVINEL